MSSNKNINSSNGLYNNLIIYGTSNLNKSITVSKTSNLAGEVIVTGDMTVLGNTILNILNVDGASTLNNVNISGNLSCS
jgi:hypothetical protein